MQYSHSPSIKTIYAKLERDDPFNNIEQAQFDEREQALIRGIQLKNKEDKRAAIQTYTNYQMKGRKATKVLASSTRKYIKSRYPKHGAQSESVQHFNKPIIKKSVVQKNKNQTSQYLLNEDNKIKNEKVYERVNRSVRKYPNASLGEHRHGVNSQWSQEYRVKRGLNRNYTEPKTKYPTS